MHWNIRCVPVTPSTNDEVRAAGEAGDLEGIVVWGLKQTAGRGRHGRTWESPQGNLYVSVLLRPAVKPQAYGHYSFVAALAMHDMVTGFANRHTVTLKWPNDVLADGKKIGGILLESGSDYLIVGMGLNVLHCPEQGLYPCISLKELTAEVPDLPVILNKLLANLDHWYAVMKKDGFAAIQAAWLQHAHIGEMSVRLPQEELRGAFAGLDNNGNLRLLLADGTERSIATGDVFPL